MLVGEAEELLHQLVFARQRSAEHGGIVAVERDHDALIKIGADGMLGERGAAAGAQIAGHTNFERNLASREFLHQLRILSGGKAMANAFGPQIQRSPNRFRAGVLAGVGGQAESIVSGVGIGLAEKLWRGFLLVAADADSGYVAIAVEHGLLKHRLGGFRAEVTHRIEDPEQRNTEVMLAALAATI